MKNKTTLNLYLFLILLSVYFIIFSFKVGFSLKPIMLVTIPIVILYSFRYKYSNFMFIYEKVFIIFVYYIIVRGLLSKYNMKSLTFIIGLIFMLILYIIVRNIASKLSYDNINSLIIITGFIFIIVSMFLYFIKYPDAVRLDRGIYRLQGLLPDPNFFALYATPIYGLSLYNFFKKEKLTQKGINLVVYTISMVSILLSCSRGGLIGVLILTILIIFKYSKLSIKNSIYIIMCLCIVYIILSFLDFSTIIYNSTGLSFNDIIDTRGNDTTGSGRINIWINGLRIFKMYCVFGIGVFNFSDYNSYYFSDYHYMHNTFLELLVENGMVGFIIFIIFLIIFFFKKSSNNKNILIKFIIFSILIQLVFLSGFATEILYVMFGLYGGLEISEKKIRYLKITLNTGG